MEKLILGKTSIEVSKIGLGAINYGTKIDEKSAFTLLDTYISMDGNFIDTANNYAVWNGGNGGESERIIGKWLTERKKREMVVISTKLGARPKDSDNKDFSNMEGLKRETIISSVEQSLVNLKTSYIDVLYLHVDDFSVSQYEVMKTLNDLINEGKVRSIACSNFYSWRIESARQICLDNNFEFFCAVQQRYSYLSPLIDADFFPQVAVNQDLHSYLNYYQDLTLVAYSPLLKGQYSSLDRIIDSKYLTDRNREKLLSLKTQENAVITVLKYITDSYNGSIALITASKVNHIMEIMKMYQ